MTFQTGAVLNVQSFGTRPENVEVPHIDTRAPSSSDWNYPIGKEWIYIGNSIYKLLSISAFRGVNTANWVQIYSSSGVTISNGNLTLATAGNKIIIATGTNASVGTTAAMTTGAVTVATTASSATALIFYSRKTTGGTTGDISITAQDGTGFTLTSTSATETSTFNWWIINN